MYTMSVDKVGIYNG
ncbi:hypothetical protein CCU_22720 [Coprococcus sp. ART55/1]|nr:hypothetical protein CCU_22720 [Coprococcus sp. ART55/1]